MPTPEQYYERVAEATPPRHDPDALTPAEAAAYKAELTGAIEKLGQIRQEVEAEIERIYEEDRNTDRAVKGVEKPEKGPIAQFIDMVRGLFGQKDAEDEIGTRAEPYESLRDEIDSRLAGIAEAREHLDSRPDLT